MSVDTYIGNRNTRNYQTIRQDGVEVMVSNTLAPYIRQIDLDCKKFLFMHHLKAQLELTNGKWVAA